MSEFPNNPEDVSSQMEPSLADRLNDAKVFPQLGWARGAQPKQSQVRVKLHREIWYKTQPPATPHGPASEIDIFDADRFGEVAPAIENIVPVSPNDFGITSVEPVRNLDPNIPDMVMEWDVVVSDSTGKAIYRGDHSLNNGKWADE